MSLKRKREDSDDEDGDTPPEKRAAVLSQLRRELATLGPLAVRPDPSDVVKVYFDDKVYYVCIRDIPDGDCGILRGIAEGRVARQPDGSVVADIHVLGNVIGGICSPEASFPDELTPVLPRGRTDHMSYASFASIANAPASLEWNTPLRFGTNHDAVNNRKLERHQKLATAAQVRVHQRMEQNIAYADRDQSHVVINVSGTEFHLPRRTLAGFVFFDLTIDTDHERDWVARPLCVRRCPAMFRAVLAVRRGNRAVSTASTARVLEECAYYQLEATSSVKAAVAEAKTNTLPLIMLVAQTKTEDEEIAVLREVISQDAMCAWNVVWGFPRVKSLDVAVCMDSVLFVKQYLNSTSKVTDTKYGGDHTLLCVAVQGGATRVEAYLSGKLGLKHPGCKCSYTIFAANTGMVDVLRRVATRAYIADHRGKSSEAIRKALRGGHVKCVRWLIDNGAVANEAFDDAVWNPASLEMMLPSLKEDAGWGAAVTRMIGRMNYGEEDVDHGKLLSTFRILLAEGADIDYCGGRTALNRASNICNVPIVTFLLENGATPTLACTFKVDTVACLDLLVAAGAEVDVTGTQRPDSGDSDSQMRGTTVLQRAVADKHFTIARHLVEKYSANVHTRDLGGKSALVTAVENGHTDLVRLFLAKPGGAREKDQDDLTTFAAIHSGNQDVMELVGKYKSPYGRFPQITTLLDGKAEVYRCYRRADGMELLSRVLRDDDARRLRWLVEYSNDASDFENTIKLASEIGACACVAYLMREGHFTDAVEYDEDSCGEDMCWLVRAYKKRRTEGDSCKEAGRIASEVFSAAIKPLVLWLDVAREELLGCLHVSWTMFAPLRNTHVGSI